MAVTNMKTRTPTMYCLAVVNTAALCITASLVLVLNPEDRISVKRGSALTLLGFVYFMTLFELLNGLALFTGAGARLRSKYRLSVGDVLDITNKLVSAVQAGLSCLTGAVVCLWSCTRDFMRSSHFMSEAYAWFGAAYFFYDIWSMYMVHVSMNSNMDQNRLKKKISKISNSTLSSGDSANLSPVAESPDASSSVVAESGAGETVMTNGADDVVQARMSFLAYCRYEPVILMHHLFIGGFGFLVIVYLRGGLGDCVFGFVYLMELSTPFVSLRGILSRLKMKATRAYLLNGILMLLTFFVCRVASLPYVCLMYSRVIGLPYFEAIKSLPTGCKISICILLLPQLYWFYLMCAGAVKMALTPSTATSSGVTEVRARR